MSCCKHYDSNSGCCYQCLQCDICHRHICVNLKTCCCYSRGWENYFSQKRINEEQERRKRVERHLLEDKIQLCETMINEARILRMILKKGYEFNNLSVRPYQDIVDNIRKLTEKTDPHWSERSLGFPEEEIISGKWKLY